MRSSSRRPAVVCVTDFGVGIEPGLLPHVFDRFRQGERMASAGYAGLGLGLAIVRELMELHGGTVYCESPGAGRGATFTIRFPFRLDSEDMTADRPDAYSSRNASIG